MSEIDLGRLREFAWHDPRCDYWSLDDADEALSALRPSVITALLDRLERAEATVERVYAEARWLASGPTAHVDTYTREAIALRLRDVLSASQDDDGPERQQDATRRQEADR